MIHTAHAHDSFKQIKQGQTCCLLEMVCLADWLFVFPIIVSLIILYRHTCTHDRYTIWSSQKHYMGEFIHYQKNYNNIYCYPVFAGLKSFVGDRIQLYIVIILLLVDSCLTYNVHISDLIWPWRSERLKTTLPFYFANEQRK